MQIIVYYCKFCREPISAHYDSLMQRLPQRIQDDINRFKTEKGRLHRLIGRIMLLHIINENMPDKGILDIEQDRFGRPVLRDGLDFNLSHSGNIVTCAFSQGLRLGIDIELIRDINIQHFKRYMTQTQWDDISSSNEPLRMFFHYWTLKESVLKAEGRGLRGGIKGIEIQDDDRVIYGDMLWKTKAIQIDDDYACHLTYDYSEDVGIQLRRFPLF
ncbi:MAG: 4'-phosphopantetheinyl transferase superfamily protein [Thermodesulfovibrionales bacterium]